MKRSDRADEAGFTLIEVMIALMIFGLLAATIQQVASGYMDHYRRLEGQTMATWIAQNQMAELRLQEEMPGTGESDQEISFGSYEWEVERTVSATEDPAMRRVDFTLYRVQDGPGEPQRQLVFSGFLGQN